MPGCSPRVSISDVLHGACPRHQTPMWRRLNGHWTSEGWTPRSHGSFAVPALSTVHTRLPPMVPCCVAACLFAELTELPTHLRLGLWSNPLNAARRMSRPEERRRPRTERPTVATTQGARMWICIFGATCAIALVSCVAAIMMQPKPMRGRWEDALMRRAPPAPVLQTPQVSAQEYAEGERSPRPVSASGLFNALYRSSYRLGI